MTGTAALALDRARSALPPAPDQKESGPMAGTSGSVSGSAPDAEYEILCDDAGAFLRRYTTLDGALVAVDTTLDGTTAYAPTGTVVRCGSPPGPALESTAHRQTGPGAVTVPAGARSVTVLVYAGAPTVAIGGGAPVPFPSGSSGTWGVDQGGERLRDEFVITGAAGSDVAVLTTREVGP